MYIIRLDDASEYMDVKKWNRIEDVLDNYGIKPIVGIIPHNEDVTQVDKFGKNENFWEKALCWREKGWRIALHGYNHVFSTNEGGINPVNKKSEFAGVSINIQRQKIKEGFNILCDNNLKPDIFFAPAHTYDEITLKVLEEETDIRIISDTFANDIYYSDGFYYIPQQTGKIQKMPFKITTICLHPNTFSEERFSKLKSFIESNNHKIISANDIALSNRKISFLDKLLRKLYLLSRRKN